MTELFDARAKYGDAFLSIFADGTIVPWRSLPLKEYLRIKADEQRGFIPVAQLEDEVFSLCVEDKSLVRQIEHLKAGTVQTVVGHIMDHSGPGHLDSFTSDLNHARALIHNSPAAILHELVMWITMAFPYRPEEVYDMDYATFVMRVVQAEQKLLQMGIRSEPLNIVQLDSQTGEEKSIDAKAMWDEQQRQRQSPRPPPQQRQQPPSTAGRDKWWDISPILEADTPHGINFRSEGEETDDTFVLDNHDRLEPREMRDYLIEQKEGVSRSKMVDDAREMYADVIERLDKRHGRK